MVNYNSLLSGNNLAFRNDNAGTKTLRCQLAATGNSEFTLQGANGTQACSLLNVNDLGCASIGGVVLSDYALYSQMQSSAVTLGANSRIGDSNILTVAALTGIEFSLGAGATLAGDTIATYAGLLGTARNLHADTTLAGDQILSIGNLNAQLLNHEDLVLHSSTSIGGSPLATKAYVDNAVEGIDWKQSVRVKVDTNVNVSNPGTAVFDGVTLVHGDRILLAGNGADSGVYEFDTSSTPLTRPLDLNHKNEFQGASVFVKGGNTHAATAWVCSSFHTTAAPGTPLHNFDDFVLNTDVPDFVQFAGSTLFNGTDGVVRDGSNLHVDLGHNYAWTGTHTYSNTTTMNGALSCTSTVALSGTRDVAISSSVSPTSNANWNSASFSGFNGTITDTGSWTSGTQCIALNQFNGGTVVGGFSGATYVAAAVYAKAPTLSGNYHASSSRMAIVASGNSAFIGEVNITSTLQAQGTCYMGVITSSSGCTFGTVTSGDITCTGSVAVTNNLTISSGNLNVKSGVLATTVGGDVTTSGTFTATGAISGAAISGTTGSFSSDLSTAGSFKINNSSTDRFVVSSTGAITTAGAATFSGNLEVDTKFSVTASTGAVSAANGALSITDVGALISSASGSFETTLGVGGADADLFWVTAEGYATGERLISRTTLNTANGAFQVNGYGAITHCASAAVTGDVACGSLTSSGAVAGTTGTFSGQLTVATDFIVNGSDGTLTAPYATFADGIEAGPVVSSTSAFIVDGSGVTTAKVLKASTSLGVGTADAFAVNTSGQITSCGTIACGTINCMGNVNATDGTFSGAVAGATFESTSDQRVKTDIVNVQSEGDRFDQLRPVTFLWTNDCEIPNNLDEQGQVQKQWGFLAQEVGEVYHDLLRGDQSRFKLAYDGFFAILVAEVQALRRRTASLESQLAAASSALAAPATL